MNGITDEAEEWLRAYVSELWAEDWDSEADSVYDDEADQYDPPVR